MLVAHADIPPAPPALIAEATPVRSGRPNCVPIVNDDGSSTTICRVSYTPADQGSDLPDSLDRTPLAQTQDDGDWPDDLTDGPGDITFPVLRTQANDQQPPKPFRGSGRLEAYIAPLLA